MILKPILRCVRRSALRPALQSGSGKREARPTFYLLTDTGGFVYQADEISKILVP